MVPRSYPLASLCFVLCLIGVETEGLLDYQGRAGIISIVRWNLRLVIFGVERRVVALEEHFELRCFMHLSPTFCPYKGFSPIPLPHVTCKEPERAPSVCVCEGALRKWYWNATDKNRPALSGAMDWWRMASPFSRVRKIFFRGRNLQENSRNSAERAIFPKFQAPKFENSEPEKMYFHTPSHSIPPLDSLLKKREIEKKERERERERDINKLKTQCFNVFQC